MKITDEYVLFSGGLSVPGGDFEVGHEHSVFVFDRQSGEIVRSFHPASPTEGLLGWYQAGAVLDIRGNSVIAVTTAPIEIMEYDLRTGRHLRTIATDSALVQALGRDFKYKVAPHSRTNFFRWWYPRAFYAHRLDDDRLLVVTRFTREDYFTKEARSIWDIYDLDSGRRISRTEAPRGYEVYDRTANGDFLAIYKNRVGESVVVRLRFESEARGRPAR